MTAVIALVRTSIRHTNGRDYRIRIIFCYDTKTGVAVLVLRRHTHTEFPGTVYVLCRPHRGAIEE